MSFLSVGPKIWFGDWVHWTISLEGKVSFAPLSIDLGRRSGFGSLTFPTLIKGNFSPFGQSSRGETKIGLGFGAQWTKPDLFPTIDEVILPNGAPYTNPFFMTYIGEISMQLVVGNSRHSSDGHSLEFFVRSGWGKEGARSFNLGVKYNYRMNYLD